MSANPIGEKFSAPVPQALGAREFMIERLILRDNTRELLRQNGQEEAIENDLITLSECECRMNVYDPIKCKCHACEGHFLLAQFYYDTEQYDKAWRWYSKIQHADLRAFYQLAVMCFEGEAPKDCTPKDAYQMMLEITSKEKDPHSFLIPYAEFHLGKAFFQGYGVEQSDEKAESWWLLAARDDRHEAVIEAQTALAFFYSRKNTDAYNLNKTLYWHNQASRNGSLESLGAMGAMNLFGIGTSKDINQAIDCLRQASERGNIYAIGLLVYAYYTRKLFTKATDLAKRVSALNDINELSRASCCLPQYICKGIAIASFILGRCLELGHGIKKDSNQAIMMYKKSFRYDPDACQLLQDYLTHEKI
ncbi:unnamed protein product [Rotaria socialis]|uniref:LRP2-binding protein n=1 Tax=Rotaria socialis TaxID=392032 RepID=A0A821PE12_9BILA|nr:unnamed protein product [Rotaria socialis]CAF4804223.1 unnamed protein product [Rotaria socialis]